MGCKQIKVRDDQAEPHIKNCNTCFPIEIFSNKECLVERYQCPIMWGVLNNPVRASCGHIYCSQCIQNSIAADSRRRCPVCRQDIGFLVKDNILQKAVSKLPANCIHSDCNWSGTLKGLEKHLKKTCKFKDLKCEYCTKVFLSMDDLTEHQTDRCESKTNELNQVKGSYNHNQGSNEQANVRIMLLILY